MTPDPYSLCLPHCCRGRWRGWWYSGRVARDPGHRNSRVGTEVSQDGSVCTYIHSMWN